MKWNKPIVNYLAFIVFCLWLLLFVTLGSIHEYDWMLGDAEFNGDRCRLHSAMLDNDYNNQRVMAYVLFLIQFIGIGFIFIRQKNWIFIISLSLLFGYASWLLIVRDLLC